MQQLEAAARSSEVRAVRRRVKQRLANAPSAVEARRQAAGLLRAGLPCELEQMRVGDLLGACRGMGPYRTRMCCRAVEIDPLCRLGYLSDVELDGLAAELAA